MGSKFNLINKSVHNFSYFLNFDSVLKKNVGEYIVDGLQKNVMLIKWCAYI
jgi:hypothetical protein